MGKVFAVHINVGRGVCAVYFKIVFFRLGKGIGTESFSIQAGTAEIVVSAVLTVGCVPGVGKGYRKEQTA